MNGIFWKTTYGKTPKLSFPGLESIMEIQWTHYFRNRCIRRHFSIEKAEEIIRYSTERYFDIDSSRKIVVGSFDNRLILIPSEENDNIITPVTIHETDRKQINFRIKNGRFLR